MDHAVTNRRFKNAIWEQFARLAKAAASPKRIELMDLLAQSPRTVEALAGLTGMSVANTSRHLQVLKGAALLDSEKSGPFVTYRLAGHEVAEFLIALRKLGQARLAEVERVTRQFLAGREGLERIDQETLAQRVRRREVTLLDVRPVEEYRAGHIPGAISVPLSELKKRLSELPRDGQIVAYCRGPYCVLAVEAVGILRTHGRKALRFEDGVPEWRLRGYPLVAGEEPSLSPATRRQEAPSQEEP
ncbi:MAG: ArsR/SmtB family transcription factor [Thermoanaerobaculia bacterium]